MGRAGPVMRRDAASPLYQGPGDGLANSLAALGERLLVGRDGGARANFRTGNDQFGGSVQASARGRALATLVGAAGARDGSVALGRGGPQGASSGCYDGRSE